MPRHKEFDRNEALEKAMTLFWQKGFEATSVQELVEQMGINRGSLYDTFGDKRSLFLEVLTHYDRIVASELITELELSGSAKQAIIQHIQGVVDQAIADQSCRGCLLTNAVVELGALDSDAAKQFSINLQQIEDAFYRALVRCREQNEINPQQDLHALARLIVCTLQGLRVISKLNPDPSTLRDIADQIIAILER